MPLCCATVYIDNDILEQSTYIEDSMAYIICIRLAIPPLRHSFTYTYIYTIYANIDIVIQACQFRIISVLRKRVF
jgi:hypothetical protein